MQAKQAATVVVVSLALPIVLAAPAEAAPYLHLSNSAPSKLALSSVPHAYLSWYQQAARTCSGLPWSVLAGIGEMESDHGQSTARGVHSAANYAGAEGPMQFEPGTFTAFAVHADRARALSPYDPQDAIFTAAHMLCADGARGGSPSGIASALYAYNHADWYPPQVMSWATKYATTGPTRRVVRNRPATAHTVRRRAIVVHTATPRRARRITAPHIPVAPHHVTVPHHVAAPHHAAGPHYVAAPHHTTGPQHAAVPHHTTSPHVVVAEPTQTSNPLAPVTTPATPVPTPTATPTPLVAPSAKPSASVAVPASSATTQPSRPAPAPSVSQPAPTPSATQTTTPQVSADSEQLAAEADQLSAEARELSDEAQQLSAEAQQLSGQHEPVQVTPALGSSGSAQAPPTAPSANSPASPSAGTPSAGTPPAAGPGTATGPARPDPGVPAAAGAEQESPAP